MRTKEIWGDIPGYIGLYKVSNKGRVKSLNRIDSRGRTLRGRILKQSLNREGRPYVTLSKHGEVSFHYVHHLVALAFLGAAPRDADGRGLWVLHRNDDRLNNHVTNLKYGTQSENELDKTRNGRRGVAGRG